MAFFTVQDIKRKLENEGISRYYAESVLMESVNIQKTALSKNYDIFLSHSYLDADYIYMIKNEIEEMGFSVYVDWIEDSDLNREKVNKETALLLKKRMKSCKSLFYVTTENYQSSKWMPWELGYFDGIKNKVAILPVLDNTSSFKGTEYLELYPYVDKAPMKNQIENTLWINENTNKYVRLEEWLDGKLPYNR